MGDNAIGRNIVLCIKHFTARKITILRTTVLLLYVLDYFKHFHSYGFVH